MFFFTYKQLFKPKNRCASRVLCCFCINSKQIRWHIDVFSWFINLQTTLLLFIINWNKIDGVVHFVCKRRIEIEIEMGDLVWVSHYLQTIQPITIQESPLWRKSVLSHKKREENGGQNVVEKLGFFSGNNFYLFFSFWKKISYYLQFLFPSSFFFIYKWF